MKRVDLITVALIAVVLTGAQAACADVTAVYKMTAPDGSATQTIRYIDKQHVRVDMKVGSANREMSMMKLGDKVYSITGKVVQDMSQLAQMMAAMGRGKKSRHTAHTPIKYEDTGRTETIAGIRGKVYRFVDDNGKRHEIVLGKDRDLQDAVLGVVEISKSSMGMMPVDWVQQDASSIKSMSLLRMDDRIRLQSMNTDAISDSLFELPAPPQQMGNIGSLMKGLPGR